MIIVYGADWCEDTRRSRRHLRRLGVPHRYRNIDEDSPALDRARALNPDAGQRRTPVIDLGLGGPPLVEPDNETLTEALVEIQMLRADEAIARLTAQNVGDLERVVRTVAGILLIAASATARSRARRLFRILGGAVALSGISGWSPTYHFAGVTSLGGAMDRPLERAHRRWVARSRGVGAKTEPTAAR
jgi:glutaredoxin